MCEKRVQAPLSRRERRLGQRSQSPFFATLSFSDPRCPAFSLTPVVEQPDWSRVKELFERALPVPAAEREQFLQASGEDAETIAEVRSLLAVYEEAPEFLE